MIAYDISYCFFLHIGMALFFSSPETEQRNENWDVFPEVMRPFGLDSMMY